jgi:hypothetical protein
MVGHKTVVEAGLDRSSMTPNGSTLLDRGYDP